MLYVTWNHMTVWEQIDKITWNNIIFSNRLEYLKLYKCVQIIHIWSECFFFCLMAYQP